ncbi:hypothetical protein ABD76_00045 [Paenibacillus dendritiformis]|nr:hypothetical protein [Paenibacillus dendritiformis]MBG9791013.1 hypothetical protein [Paenibacillus dendritiformis]
MGKSTEQDNLYAGNDFFKSLERFERKLSPRTNQGLKRDSWLLLVIATGFVISLLPFGATFSPEFRLASALTGLCLQAGALGVFSYRQLRDTVPDFIDARRKFAVELDQYFADREEVLVWLGSVPGAVREARLSYVEARLDSLRSRYALVFGAVDKLGLLPVLVGVFVQIRATGSLSLPSMIFGILIVVLYAMSLWITQYRLQLEAYGRLIRAAGER